MLSCWLPLAFATFPTIAKCVRECVHTFTCIRRCTCEPCRQDIVGLRRPGATHMRLTHAHVQPSPYSHILYSLTHTSSFFLQSSNSCHLPFTSSLHCSSAFSLASSSAFACRSSSPKSSSHLERIYAQHFEAFGSAHMCVCVCVCMHTNF
jgi:hypothetical protein